MKLFFRQEDASLLESLIFSVFSKEPAAGLGIELCDLTDWTTLLGSGPGDRMSGMGEENLHLFFHSDGLSLQSGDLSMQGDFLSLMPRIRQNRLGQEMLVKACRIRGTSESLSLFDATAGMGEDSFLLAAAGFDVILYEADPVIALLLADSLRRAAEMSETAAIAGRMHLFYGDSIAAMKNLTRSPDVILLDPMFPQRKKSGLIKKKFQLLQQLERPCDNEEELLAAAITAAPRKIVIKRPAKGPELAGHRPDYSLDGKTIRYDCIVTF